MASALANIIPIAKMSYDSSDGFSTTPGTESSSPAFNS